MAARRPHRPRGAAITEMALVLPLLVSVFLFAIFLTELVRARLKLQEVGRFAAWEMTSHPLSDFGSDGAARHAQAFERARRATENEVTRRFEDLDSVDEKPPAGWVFGLRGPRVVLTNAELGADADMRLGGSPEGGSFAGPIVDAAVGSVSALHRRFGFDTAGKVRVEVSLGLENRFLPQRYLDQGAGGMFSVDHWGGRDLKLLTLKANHSLVASSWFLADGTDAQMSLDGRSRDGPAAGLRRNGTEHGLRRQVGRMAYLGLSKSLGSVPGLGALSRRLSFGLPNPFAAYVVSHNYGLDTGVGNRGCDSNDAHPAKEGLNNLERASTLDTSKPRCFDTAPFRDQASYQDSLYIQLFKARGAYFMGCANPMADDPTESGAAASSVGDQNTSRVECGFGVP